MIEPVRHSKQLRERYFGALDGQSDSRYVEVWSRDSVDAKHSEFGVESTVNVVRRTIALVGELEARYRERVILLVAHGDVLQLLQTAFQEISPAQHRQLPPLQVAEIRQLVPVLQR